MQGYAAYAKTQASTGSDRETEYRLLGAVTGALVRARDTETTLQEKVKAVLWNDKVWNAFMCDLGSAENNLPKALKGALMSLAIWVAKETQRILDNEVDLNGLININRQIMEGLRPKQVPMAAS
ncbi:flagellar biosynthesis regulator FlaF [Alphaproteobacteria bacterium]|jgi:flagellar protein FlaF|nr:flagellar biosynthesis regulator FlaF [Alphaproteobacteria bacterium]